MLTTDTTKISKNYLSLNISKTIPLQTNTSPLNTRIIIAVMVGVIAVAVAIAVIISITAKE